MDRRGNSEHLREIIADLLGIVAMIPEERLTEYAIDPYGRIGDALRAIGKDPEPDAWTALWQLRFGVSPPDPAKA